LKFDVEFLTTSPGGRGGEPTFLFLAISAYTKLRFLRSAFDEAAAARAEPRRVAPMVGKSWEGVRWTPRVHTHQRLVVTVPTTKGPSWRAAESLFDLKGEEPAEARSDRA